LVVRHPADDVRHSHAADAGDPLDHDGAGPLQACGGAGRQGDPQHRCISQALRGDGADNDAVRRLEQVILRNDGWAGLAGEIAADAVGHQDGALLRSQAVSVQP
jgi:hypothetical protein